MSAGILAIDRLRLDLRACTVPDRAPAIERRLRDAVQRGLQQALAAPDGEDDDGTAMVFIDRLDIETSVNTAWDDTRIVTALAGALARGLGTALARPGDAQAFSDRAEWLAAFFIALVDGQAWQRWWFDELEGLRLLPLSGALRSAVVREGEPALQALARLTRADARRVAAALDEADVGRVLAAWGERGPSAGPGLPPMVLLWLHARALGAGDRRALLRALIEIEREHPGQGTSCLLSLAALADLAAFQAGASEADAAPAAGDAGAELRARCRVAGVDAGWLAALDPAQATELCAAMRASGDGPGGGPDAGGDTATPTADGPRSTAERWHCDHGGAFTLLVVLGWLGLPARWRRRLAAEPGCAGQAAPLARALALAVVAHALHPAQPQRVAGDPALQHALALADAHALLQRHAAPVARALRAERIRRVDAAEGDAAAAHGDHGDHDGRPDPTAAACRPAADPPLIGRRTDHRLAGIAAAVLARLAERVPGCESASADWLRANLLSAPASVSVESTASHTTVTCGRAPLHVLLLLGGLARAGVDLPGLRIELHTEELA